jgi:hypothetical protein
MTPPHRSQDGIGAALDTILRNTQDASTTQHSYTTPAPTPAPTPPAPCGWTASCIGPLLVCERFFCGRRFLCGVRFRMWLDRFLCGAVSCVRALLVWAPLLVWGPLLVWDRFLCGGRFLCGKVIGKLSEVIEQLSEAIGILSKVIGSYRKLSESFRKLSWIHI